MTLQLSFKLYSSFHKLPFTFIQSMYFCFSLDLRSHDPGPLTVSWKKVRSRYIKLFFQDYVFSKVRGKQQKFLAGAYVLGIHTDLYTDTYKDSQSNGCIGKHPTYCNGAEMCVGNIFRISFHPHPDSNIRFKCSPLNNWFLLLQVELSTVTQNNRGIFSI